MIVITGGAGFIGSAMLWELNRNGIEDVIVVDELASATTGKWRNLAGLGFRDFIHKNDFLERLSSGRVPGGISAVIHMGAISDTTETDADLLLKNNYEFSKELATQCIAGGIRLVYASSAATYGDGSRGYSDEEEHLESLRPLNMYGYSKQLFDLWALRSKALAKFAGLKFFNVFGPNEYHKGDMSSVVFKAFNQIRETGEVRLFESHRSDYRHGEQMRDFIYVKDCTAIMLWLLENPSVNGIFNVGSGKARSFRDLVGATFSAMEREPSIRYVPMPEKLRDKYQYFTQAEAAKLKAYGCPVEPLPLEEGVRDYVCNHLATANPYLDRQRT